MMIERERLVLEQMPCTLARLKSLVARAEDLLWRFQQQCSEEDLYHRPDQRAPVVGELVTIMNGVALLDKTLQDRHPLGWVDDNKL